MLRDTLALYAYTPPSDLYPLIVAEYGAQVEELEFTTVAPGGFGDLACGLRLADARLPRPELGLFSRVCLRDGTFTAFQGEWSDPALVMDEAGGEYLWLTALGAGACLRDDPDDAAYTTPATAQSVIATELARRAAYLPLDQDTAAILPDQPAATFTPVYDGANLEEVLHDLMGALGDYTWAVYDHPSHTDAAGFPTWRLQSGPRDLTTTTHIALGEDIASWRVAPSTERAYNVAQLAYVDPATGPGVVTVSDPRLNADGSQGAAPFRRRKLRRSLGTLPLTAAQATTIAQAWLAAYSQPTSIVEMVLRGVRDAHGAPIPLSHVRAGGNLFAPELAACGQTLSSGPQPGVNQFSIVESRYRETADGDITLTLQLDNYADRVEGLLARLRLTDDALRRRRGVYHLTQSPGAQQMGFAAIRAPSASAGQVTGASVSFVPTLARTPTGLTFATISATNVGSGPTVTAGSLTPWGCEITVTASASGAVAWHGTWTTVGA
ncbi:MAG TPA: hypothetical protein VFQ25_08440 [Ktedonobacterales bacterium]|nr:hypothetical protein [Ktedonobacterales bacterium]